MPNLVKRFAKCRRGTAMIEFAFITPVLLLLIFGTFEFASYILLNQKLRHAAMAMADLTSREETLTEAQLNGLFASVQNIVNPFPFGPRGTVIVSAVSANVDNAPLVFWQRTGAGTLAAASRIGAEGGDATLPAGFTVLEGETIIAAEIYYDYDPWFLTDILPTEPIYETAYFRPRLGLLQALEAEAGG
jgi:Flp pilus assembly protein TadG